MCSQYICISYMQVSSYVYCPYVLFSCVFFVAGRSWLRVFCLMVVKHNNRVKEKGRLIEVPTICVYCMFHPDQCPLTLLCICWLLSSLCVVCVAYPHRTVFNIQLLVRLGSRWIRAIQHRYYSVVLNILIHLHAVEYMFLWCLMLLLNGIWWSSVVW